MASHDERSTAGTTIAFFAARRRHEHAGSSRGEEAWLEHLSDGTSSLPTTWSIVVACGW
jgi:nicotinic acid phosphoribosyltransferase